MRKEISGDFLATLGRINYLVGGMLSVHGVSEERQKARDILLNQVHSVLFQNPQLAQKYSGVGDWSEEFRAKMSLKRTLGHTQRLLFSGDLSMIEFGLTIINYLKKADINDKPYQVLFRSEGGCTQMAWTISPFLMEEGIKFSKILLWIESGQVGGQLGCTPYTKNIF